MVYNSGQGNLQKEQIPPLGNCVVVEAASKFELLVFLLMEAVEANGDGGLELYQRLSEVGSEESKYKEMLPEINRYVRELYGGA